MILYGIPNCDTTKKAMDWLKQQKINFEFHNYKEAGITLAKLNEWCNKVGWEKVFNKRSTTWKELSPKQQEGVINQQTAVQVMKDYNSIIKRPIIEYKGNVLIGFDAKKYAEALH